MKTFFGMEVEQDDTGIKLRLHLDHYIQTVLSEYTEYIKKSLGLRRSHSLQVLFSALIKFRQCRISSNKSTTGHSWLSFSLQRLGSGWISPLLFRSLLDFVHRQGQLNGRPSTTLWNIWKATLASRLIIGEAMVKRICCLATQIRLGQ